jgi:hypothetical protein
VHQFGIIKSALMLLMHGANMKITKFIWCLSVTTFVTCYKILPQYQIKYLNLNVRNLKCNAFRSRVDWR